MDYKTILQVATEQQCTREAVYKWCAKNGVEKLPGAGYLLSPEQVEQFASRKKPGYPAGRSRKNEERFKK